MKTFYENGIYNISNEQYHLSSGHSRSQLLLTQKSMHDYKYNIQHGFVKNSDAMQLGEAVHAALLEPNTFNEKYLTYPDVKRNTKEGKAIYAAAVEEANGRIMLKAQELVEILCMATQLEHLLKDCLSNDFLHPDKIERSIFFNYPGTQLQLKCRPDAFNKGIAIDIKTCKDASYRGFQRAAMQHGYFMQAAMVKHALESQALSCNKFIFLCVENTEPYTTGAYVVSEDALNYGRMQVSMACNKIERARHDEEFLGYGLKTLEVPQWALNEEFE